MSNISVGSPGCGEHPADLVAYSTTRLSPNTCFKYYRRVFFNKEISEVVTAANGVRVRMSAGAQNALKGVYDGTPMCVHFKVPPQCCGRCVLVCPCMIICQNGCCAEECVPTIAEPLVADHIWFGKQDAQASCPEILTWCCIGGAIWRFAEMYYEKRVFVDAAEFQIVLEGQDSVQVAAGMMATGPAPMQ